MNERKLYVGFNWILYGLHGGCTGDELPNMISGQKSVVMGTLEHSRVRANLGINDWSIAQYQDSHPEMIDLIRSGLEDSRFELTSMTHMEPILSLIPYGEMKREVELNVQTLEKTFGRRPTGAYNPEMGWDPVSAKVLLDNGLSWIVLSNWQLYKLSSPRISSEDQMYRPAQINAIDDRQITGVFASLEKGDWNIPHEIPGPGIYLHRYLLGRKRAEPQHRPARQDPHTRLQGFPADDFDVDTLDHLVPAMERLQSMNRNGDMLVLFCFDSETFWREPYLGTINLSQGDMERRFSRFLGELENLPYVEFTTVGDYLRNVQPEFQCYIQPSVGLFDRDGFGIWERGAVNQAYSLNIQCHEAADMIRSVQTLVDVARMLGRDVGDAESLIESAREDLSIARQSSGRGYGPIGWFTNWCSESAVAAIEKMERAHSILIGGSSDEETK